MSMFLHQHYSTGSQPIKASASGIVFLKETDFKNRYTGSKHFTYGVNEIVLKSSIITEKHNKIKTSASDGTDLISPKEKQSYSINKSLIRRRLLTFVLSAPDKKKFLYFFTVTFPEGISDDLAFEMYNIWFTKLRQLSLIKNYLWVSERQQNGTIHFHIAVPHFMNVMEANRQMKIILINKSRHNLIKNSTSFLMKYNGVHISKNRAGRAVNFAIEKKKKSLLRYITKYITKNDGNFSHFAWHNSRDFSSLFTGITFTISEFTKVYNLKKFVNKKSILSNNFFQFHGWINGPPGFVIKQFQIVNSFIFSNN